MRRRPPDATRRAARRPPAPRSPRSCWLPSGGRPRPERARRARPRASARVRAGQPIALATPVTPASRKYGQTTCSSSTVTTSSPAATPTISAKRRGRDEAPRHPVGEVAGRQREQRQRHELAEADQPEVERAGGGSRRPATRPRPRSCSRRSASRGSTTRGARNRELERRRQAPSHRPKLPTAALGSARGGDETTAGEARPPRRAPRRDAPPGERGDGRASDAIEGKLTRARAARDAARPGLVRRARPVRPPPRGRVRDARPAAVGRRGRHRLRDDLRPQGLRLLAGLHDLRRLAVRGLRREDLQGDGPGGEVRLPGDRDQRLRRRADPGGRRLARRLRGDLLAERAVPPASSRRSRS